MPAGLQERQLHLPQPPKRPISCSTKCAIPRAGCCGLYAGGKAKLPGYLDDYAFFIDGLIALHQATGDDAGWMPPTS